MNEAATIDGCSRLQTFMGEFIIRWDLLTAGGVITALLIVFFMLVQRHLIAGLTAGAVKG